MEKLPSVKALLGAIIAIFFFQIIASFYHEAKIEVQSDVSMMGSYLRASSILIHEETGGNDILKEENLTEVLEVPMAQEALVYDGMTLQELGAKLNRSLKSTLSGYGQEFARLSLDYGVDPYVALAIVLHETGCYYGECSTLAKECNNIGGMKGNPGCKGGSYQKFSSLEEGMEAFIKNLSKNYYQLGLTTVEQIGKKYAEGNTWSTKVNDYILKIKAN